MIIEIKNTFCRIDFSFAFIIALMLLLFDEETVVLCFISSILHESGHLIFMVSFSQRIKSIVFGSFGVRIERYNASSISYKKEAFIALGGIIINIFVAILAGLYYYLKGSAFSFKLMLVNIVIALFNSVPVEILDMGRAVRYFMLCYKDASATDKAMRFISLMSVNVLLVISVVYTACCSINPSLIAVTVYLYVITLFKKWS